MKTYRVFLTFFKRAVIAFFVVVFLLLAKHHIWDMHINHNFETITENKVYKSGVIPPDEIAEYVDKYKIKSIIDLRKPGTLDVVNNPERAGQVEAERKAAEAIPGLQYFNIPSDQTPSDDSVVDKFLDVMKESDNYPVLIHCHHGEGRAHLYSAIYRIEFEGMDNELARQKTREFRPMGSFSEDRPKGAYLINYQKRLDNEVQKTN